MYRFLVILVVFVGFAGDMQAQRHSDPRSYYREFQSQNRRIQLKNMRYLESVVRGDEPRRVEKMREMVLEQLKDSKRELERVGAYQDDEVLHREYMRALDLYIHAFEENFNKADELIATANESYADRMKYYEAQNTAEREMMDAVYKIEEAENYFAKTYRVDLRRDEEDRRRFDKLDLLTVYTREVSKPFYRVDAQMQSFFKAVEERKADTLNDIVMDLRKALIESQEQLQDVPAFDGKEWLEEEVASYLEELSAEMDETIQPLADKLSNQFLPEDEYEDAMGDFENLKEWQMDELADFNETRNQLVERYLEED